MRYQCDIPGLEQCFVEFSDHWSRKEVRDYFNTKGRAYLDLLEKKMTGAFLICPDNAPIETAFRLDDETLDKLDIRLVHWVASVPFKHVQGLGELGEALALRLFGFTGANSDQATDAPMPSPTPG